MAQRRFLATDLLDLAAGLLRVAGAPDDAAEVTASLLVRAELSGHGSHGLRLLPEYCDRCESGRVDPSAEPVVESDNGSTIRLDGRNALGQIAGMRAVTLALERARTHGVAVVTMRRSGHLGRLADYVEAAAERGMIAIVAANDSGANQVVAPYGSVEPRLATNPIAIGIPRQEPPHLVLDMSTSVVSHGTLDRARLEGLPVPGEWTIGDVLLPLGGPKGTGLALVVEVLAGVLSGAGFCGDGGSGVDDQGVWILALDPTRFLHPHEVEEQVEQLVRHVHSAEPAEPGGDVRVPGEPGADAARTALSEGVHVPAMLWEALASRARAAGIAVPTHVLTERR